MSTLPTHRWNEYRRMRTRYKILERLAKGKELGFNEIQEVTGLSSRSIASHLQEMVREGKVAKSGVGKYSIASTTSEDYIQQLRTNLTSFEKYLNRERTAPMRVTLATSTESSIASMELGTTKPLQSEAEKRIQENLRMMSDQLLNEVKRTGADIQYFYVAITGANLTSSSRWLIRESG